MDLKDKLRFIESLPRQQQRGISFTNTRPVDTDIASCIEGELRSSDRGTYFYAERDFPIGHQHGCVQLAGYLNHSPEFLPIVGKDAQISATDPRKLIFIDTETTGLSGGSGTYVFLVGLGYVVEDRFRVAQYFMPDLNSEAAILHEISDILAGFEVIVSFNGKSYDLPLLSTRHIVHRMRPCHDSIPHLDLLYSVRRFWKHRMLDCSLQTTEREIIEFSRTGDIPGYLIPYTYFRFLHEHDPRPLAVLFSHNRLDILSMAGILSRAMHLIADPMHVCCDSREIVALGRIYEELLQHDKSLALYEASLDNFSGNNDRRDLLMRMAFIHKKLQQWAQAAELWHHYLEQESYHPLPYIELAKHYEHRERDYKKARELVEQALGELEIVTALGRNGVWIEYEEDLLHRRKRLVRKLSFEE